jgi:hypothetical protein
MTELGVDYGQGFSMGKPMPLKEVLQEFAIYEATVNDRPIEPAPSGSASGVTRLKRSMLVG